MHDLPLVPGALPGGEPPGGPAHQRRDLGRIVVDQAARDDLAVGAGQVDRVARIETPLGPGDPRGQQRRPAEHDRPDRARVQHQRAPGGGGVCQPQLPGRGTAVMRGEIGADRLAGQRQCRLAGPGHHRGDACLGRDQGRVDLGDHAPGAHPRRRAALPRRTGRTGRAARRAGRAARRAEDDTVQLRAALHPADPPGTGMARVEVVEPVHIGQQDERPGPDHVRDQRGQPVVVAEPDLVGGHRVVLVHHRQDAQFE